MRQISIIFDIPPPVFATFAENKSFHFFFLILGCAIGRVLSLFLLFHLGLFPFNDYFRARSSQVNSAFGLVYC
jgi:hypothetical protein